MDSFLDSLAHPIRVKSQQSTSLLSPLKDFASLPPRLASADEISLSQSVLISILVGNTKCTGRSPANLCIDSLSKGSFLVVVAEVGRNNDKEQQLSWLSEQASD